MADSSVNLTSNQTAERFQVSVRTIQRWVRLGIFPKPLKIGGVVRFRLADIEAFEKSGWLNNSPMRSGWDPDQSDVPADDLGTADDVKDND